MLLAYSVLLCAAIQFLWCLCLLRCPQSKILSDIPNSRSSHSTPSVRGGGALFSLFFLAGIFVSTTSSFSSLQLTLLSLGLVLTGLVGFLDDLFHVPPKIRLLTHLIASSICCIGLGFLEQPSLGVALLWIIYAATSINFFNFADGINGYVGSTALLGFVYFLSGSIGPASFTLFPNTATLLLGAAVSVFLIFNLATGRLFMGDAGSTVIGLVFAILVGTAIRNNQLAVGSVGFAQSLTTFTVLTAPAVFLYTDCLSMLAAKVISGVPIAQPHRHHLYQRLSRAPGMSHLRATLTISTFHAIFSFSVIQANDLYGPSTAGMLSTGFVLFLFLTSSWTHIRHLKRVAAPAASVANSH
jgi:Fuc2NAc and GlcNAc transferase